MNILVTAVVPNYNEHANLERGVLLEIEKYFLARDFGWEVIVSDDGSTDGSLEYLRKFVKEHANFRLLENKHAGKPYAIRSAIKIARGEFVLFTDMDQSTPITELDKLLPYTKKGSKVVIGSRGAKRPDSTPIRQLASVIFLLARRAILLPRIKDTQCGFKLLDTKLADKIFKNMRIFGRDHKATGWKVTAYDVEMLFLARKFQMPITEVKVIWRNEDTSVGKKRNFVKESIEMFAEILRVRVNDLLGKYD